MAHGNEPRVTFMHAYQHQILKEYHSSSFACLGLEVYARKEIKALAIETFIGHELGMTYMEKTHRAGVLITGCRKWIA